MVASWLAVLGVCFFVAQYFVSKHGSDYVTWRHADHGFVPGVEHRIVMPPVSHGSDHHGDLYDKAVFPAFYAVPMS